jgi:glutathione S-transferase
MRAMKLATLAEARGAPGLRLVTLAAVPSPWSEVAKGIFDVKGLEYLAVRMTPGDPEICAWTGHHNAPVALYDDEAPRAAWAEILALAERLAPEPPLLGADENARADALALAGAVLDQGGLVWCARLLLVHAGLTTDGARGFPPRIARYLGGKYGYDPARADAAHARVRSILAALGERLADGRRYLVGDRLTVADIAVSCGLVVLAPLPEADCSMSPVVRRAYETTDPAIVAAVPPRLLAHRDAIYARHLPLPVRC